MHNRQPNGKELGNGGGGDREVRGGRMGEGGIKEGCEEGCSDRRRLLD
jgi:hypothetical protein